MSDSVRPYGLQPARLLCPWDSPGQSTVVGCHFLLQGIFLTQGWSGKIPYAMEQLSLCVKTTEACMPRDRALQQEKSLE